MKDFLGNELKRGDWVVFAGGYTFSERKTLTIGRVTEARKAGGEILHFPSSSHDYINVRSNARVLRIDESEVPRNYRIKLDGVA